MCSDSVKIDTRKLSKREDYLKNTIDYKAPDCLFVFRVTFVDERFCKILFFIIYISYVFLLIVYIIE